VIAQLASVPAFFLLRIMAGLVLLKLSASLLPVAGFTDFTQFMLFAALLNLAAVGGAQNGLIRQAAASGDAATLSRVHGAGLLIWGVAAPVLAVAIAFGSGRICRILIDSTDQRWAVVTIALVALATGPGQIWCSILSGRKQVVASLAAQAIGLAAGTGAAAWLIARGQPLAATIAFAGGSLVTMAVAGRSVARLRIARVPLAVARREARALLTYSASFAAMTGWSSILLFGLRAHYRAHFGTVPLGYWLVANRISDMSTQLLGLFLIQFFVPHFAMLRTERERRALAVRCWAVGVAVMGLVPLVFSLLAPGLVHLFLSDAYRPAIPAIRTYMIGDTLRVWASIAMFTAFARGRPERCAAIEIATLALMAAIMLLLTAEGEPRAPFIGYCGAYATTAAIATIAFLTRGATRSRRPAVAGEA
jgi:O-antigen/teichoic acid export membrane protein